MNYYADGGQAMASPIQEMPASQIIMNDAESKKFGAEKVVQAISQLVDEGKAVLIRHNNSILLLIQIGDVGGLEEIIWQHVHLREGIYLYKGALTDSYISHKFDLKFTDLNLLIASSKS